MQAIERLLERNGLRVAATAPAHRDWSQDAAFLRELDACSLVVVNGEGSLHHDRPEAERLLAVGAYARSRGKPAVLVNAGWEANSPQLAARLRDFARVCARDTRSAQRIREAGIACDVVGDLSLYLAVSPGPAAAPGAPLAFTDSVDRLKALALERCRRTLDASLLSILFPAQGAGGYPRFLREGIAASDLRAPGRLAALLRARHALWRASSRRTDEFLARLAGFGFVVSGRFHACTLALLTGTPFAALASNTAKIESLVEDAGLEPWRARIDLEKAAVTDAARRGWSVAERRAIDDYVAGARSGAERLFRELKDLA
ncbi:MAG TPA: polysaccharide pyruvyl transferase family protein [Usitatibacter sp.]|nr:polysaccharide pyruvyl transferase family protein [Usitatibacter sp.]